MTQIRNYIYIAILLFSLSISAQKSMDNDPEILQGNINFRIEEAHSALDNYNYLEAQNNLNEALKLAEKLNNKKSLGIIHTFKARLQLINNESDNAITSL